MFPVQCLCPSAFHGRRHSGHEHILLIRMHTALTPTVALLNSLSFLLIHPHRISESRIECVSFFLWRLAYPLNHFPHDPKILALREYSDRMPYARMLRNELIEPVFLSEPFDGNSISFTRHYHISY